MKPLLVFVGRAITTIYILSVIYPLYLLLVGMYLVLRATGCVKITHPELIPHVGERCILLSNHPAMLDVLLLPALLWRSCLRHPLRGPMIVADRQNFYNSWYWFLFRPFLIPVDRGEQSDKSLLRIKRALDKGRLIIYFYEGGRTYKGRELLVSPSNKNFLRKPKNDAIGLLVSKTGANVSFAWIEGSDHAMPNEHGRLFNLWRLVKSIVCWRMAVTVKVGRRFLFEKWRFMDKSMITQSVIHNHLRLADE